MNKQKQNLGKGCLIALGSWRLGRRGQTVFEYAAIIMFVLAAFLVFQKYIARGLAGRWKGVGDSLGQGRIYDPHATVECEYSPTAAAWFDRVCFDGCSAGCGAPTNPACVACVAGCTTAQCAQ